MQTRCRTSSALLYLAPRATRRATPARNWCAPRGELAQLVAPIATTHAAPRSRATNPAWPAKSESSLSEEGVEDRQCRPRHEQREHECAQRQRHRLAEELSHPRASTPSQRRRGAGRFFVEKRWAPCAERATRRQTNSRRQTNYGLRRVRLARRRRYFPRLYILIATIKNTLNVFVSARVPDVVWQSALALFALPFSEKQAP